MKKWVVRNVYKQGDSLVPLLLENRGIKQADWHEFLHPRELSFYIKSLPVEFKKSLKNAQKEILGAVKENLPIIIHGDYDADGICATAILYKALTESLGYRKVLYYVPNRFDQGYGLSTDSVKEIADTVTDRYGTSSGLIVTVDCGITVDTSVVESIKNFGFELVVTDHHQKKTKDPKAKIVLWNSDMAGAGISLTLAIVLGAKDAGLVSLAGIATVTDLIPLKGINRALVTKSLEILNLNPPLGIKKLLEMAGRGTGEVSTYDIGYVIGPRLNATGRLESAYESLRLLLEEDEQKVGFIASKLNALNTERQVMTQKMFDLADGMSALSTDKIIIVASEEFHEGVVGLVAGKLTQKYHKPSLVISLTEGIAKGSARSVPGVNIVEILRQFESVFRGLGGHPMAAGFSMPRDSLDRFKSDISEYAVGNISSDLLTSQLTIDVEIPLAFITPDLVNEVLQLKPFGIGNPEPLFLSRCVGVSGCDFVGKEGNHLALKFFDGKNIVKGIMFDAKNLGVTGFSLGTKLDIVYTAGLKEYNGRQYLDLVIKDFSTL